MHVVGTTLSAALLLAAVARAQATERVLVYREFDAVVQLRVVCRHGLFGRVSDLVADAVTGRIAAVVVDTDPGQEVRAVAVPFAALDYDARTNLLRIDCGADGEAGFPRFEPAAVGVTLPPSVDDAGVRPEPTGTFGVAQLRRGRVRLRAGEVTVAGVTVELTSGHVAFLDLTEGRPGAGDSELHPVPWSALRWQPAAAGDGQRPSPPPVLALPWTARALAAAPNRIEVILQDPLYRARVYEFFAVARPPYDVEV